MAVVTGLFKYLTRYHAIRARPHCSTFSHRSHELLVFLLRPVPLQELGALDLRLRLPTHPLRQ